MRLKKVEIQGFKSFADKTEVNIKEGITAIVGPNGSGKSNISDAIRWVLGEQSIKNLRGNKMEDVIFTGTSKRKPLGYAEVTITFDNKDSKIPIEYNEVAVTRRIFRSGESEYYINKNSCRLKDIRELFMDTGVGKDGYSIIGQGRIEEILSNRPEDRRSIFEEAAGIVKYKSKKEEAERKLEKTQENIIRIKDLVFELSNQLKVLEVQSQKASKFTELFGKLKDLDINLTIKDIKKLNFQLDDLMLEKNQLEETLNINKDQSQKIEVKFNLLKEKMEELESNIEIERTNISNINNQIDQNKSELAIINEKHKFYNKDLNRLEDEKKSFQTKDNMLKEQNKSLEIEMVAMEKEYSILLDEYNEKSFKLENELEMLNDDEKNIENEKNNIIKLYNRLSDIKSELNSIGSFKENIDKRINQLQREISSLEIEKNQGLTNYNEIIEKEKEINLNLLNFKKKLVETKSIYESDLKQRENKIIEINKNNGDMQSKSSSLKLLQNMEDDYEGYNKGVKMLLKSYKKEDSIKDSILGVIADLIKVNDKYEKAIEISLGANAQNIVTPNEMDAKAIIEYLKKTKMGRVTLLPLNVIKGNTLTIDESHKKEFNIVGLGHELIEYDNIYDNIFKSLLGRTVVIDTIDNGIKYAKKINHSQRIVTLDGEVINAGGAMTGGSYSSNNISIISRKNKIDAFMLEIKDLDLVKDSLESHITQLNTNIKTHEKSILEIEASIKESEFALINLNGEKNKFNNDNIRIENNINRSLGEISSLEKEIGEYSLKKQELTDSLSKVDKEIENKKDSVKALSDENQKNKTYRDNQLKIFTDMKININSIENKIKNIQEKITKNNQEVENIFESLKEKESTIIANRENIEEISQRKLILDKELSEITIIEGNIKETLDNLIIEKNQVMGKFYSQQEELRNISKIVSEIEKNINSNELKSAKYNMQLENFYKKLLDDYELTYEAALGFEKELSNVQEAIVETRKLKMQIKELGTVNLSSIEEHKQLKERLDFILGQQQDLMEAKDSLRDVIRDIEYKMKEQFIINFKEINKNFQEIFKILFNGGQAELVIEDEEDLLNSGIEIKAQPPGKKLQSLTLLSGGEKSLTAVALLFGILKLKPSPFCILDEIDAALDEANISRYTGYLKNICEDTQFVLITHRKTTMEIADMLYGVAMEEEGISKLISVKLKDNKEIAS